MSIEKDIASWNGKSADDIREVYDRYGHKPSFAQDVISLIDREALQRGASWLLKKYFEDQRPLGKADVNRIYSLLQKLNDWETKLHILQSMPYMSIEKRQVKRVHRFLQACLADDNKFVRAWAYNGFYLLAVQHREYEEETRQFFDMAMKDEAASVKARIRNLLKKGFR